MVRLLMKMGAIALLHCIVGVLLYRGRVVSHIPILHSDVVVFAIPCVAALIAYGVASWSARFLETTPVLRILTVTTVSVVATFLSFWLFMLVAFNRYGT